MKARDRAQELLTHYLRALYYAAGLEWTGDNDAEMGQLVDALTAAAEPAQVLAGAPGDQGPTCSRCGQGPAEYCGDCLALEGQRAGEGLTARGAIDLAARRIVATIPPSERAGRALCLLEALDPDMPDLAMDSIVAAVKASQDNRTW